MNPVEPPTKRMSLTKVTGIFIGLYLGLVIFYLIAVVFISGQTTRSGGKLSRAYIASAERAHKLQEQGKLDEAIAEINQTLTTMSLSIAEKADAYQELAYLKYAQSSYTDAIDAAKLSLQYDSKNDMVYVTLAAAYGELDDQQASLDYANQAIAINPQNHAAYYNQGLALSILGRRQEALAALQKAVDLAPDNLAYKNALQQVQQR